MKTTKTYQVYIFDEHGAESKHRIISAKSKEHVQKILREKDHIKSSLISDIIEIN